MSLLNGCSMLSQAVQPSAGKESWLWDLIHSLQERSSWNRAKPFLTLETRYFQATSLGFPLEISKYYQSINAINVNGKEITIFGLEMKKVCGRPKATGKI